MLILLETDFADESLYPGIDRGDMALDSCVICIFHITQMDEA